MKICSVSLYAGFRKGSWELLSGHTISDIKLIPVGKEFLRDIFFF